MDAIAGLLLDGTGLALWSFLLLCGVSFLGSLIAAALALGGGALVLATLALFLPPAGRCQTNANKVEFVIPCFR